MLYQGTQVLVASKPDEGFCSSLGQFELLQLEEVFGSHEMLMVVLMMAWLVD